MDMVPATGVRVSATPLFVETIAIFLYLQEQSVQWLPRVDGALSLPILGTTVLFLALAPQLAPLALATVSAITAPKVQASADARSAMAPRTAAYDVRSILLRMRTVQVTDLVALQQGSVSAVPGTEHLTAPLAARFFREKHVELMVLAVKVDLGLGAAFATLAILGPRAT